ncbi:MAG TPA: response regulator [Firmicutes bacterium]|nr:response regulator [Bacillota bacterium]
MKTNSFQKVLLRYFLMAGVISILFILSVVYFSVIKNIRQDVFEKNTLIADMAQRELLRYFEEVSLPLFLLKEFIISEDPAMHDKKTVEQVMDIILSQERLLQRVVIINSKKRIIHIAPFDADLIGTDMSGHAYVRFLSEEWEEPRLSDTFIFGKTGNPAAALILTAGDKDIIAYIDLGYLNEIVQTIVIGETGMAFVTDRHGAVIAHPDTKIVQQKTNIRDLNVLKTTPGVAEKTALIKTEEGRKIVSASFLEPGGWTFYFVQSSKEAFADLYRAVYSFLIGLIIFVLLAIVFGRYFAKKSIQPLIQLNRTAQTVAEGEYSQPHLPDSYKEINELGDSISRMVEAVLSRETALVENERILSTLLSNLPGAAYRCVNDGNWTMVFLSDGVKDLTGYAPDQILQNKEIPYSELIHEEDRRKVYSAIQKAISEKDFFEIVYRIYHKDGSLRWLWEKGQPIFDHEDARFIEGFITDISELKQKERQIQDIQKLEILGELAGGLAHDFNNVLSGISGTLSLMKLKKEKSLPLTEEEIGKYIKTIDHSIERASSIVQELLTLSMQKEPVKEKIDFKNVMENILHICENTLDKSIEMEAKIYPGPVIIEGDKAQLEQVLLNLCINASHAMTLMREHPDEFGGQMTLSLEPVHLDADTASRSGFSPGEPMACATVADTGVGIDDEDLTHIFEPFFTLKKKYRGTGLGLAMAESIIKRHNGFLTVDSKKGKGSCFSLYLPLLVDHPDVRTAKSQEYYQKNGGHGEVILLVDDETIIRETLKEIIEIHGYVVLTASDGEEAVEVYKKERSRIRLVIMDMLMPRLSGEEAFLKMKAVNPTVKVLLASGFKRDERILRTLEQGAAGFLQKPIDLNILFEMIRKILPSSKKQSF